MKKKLLALLLGLLMLLSVSLPAAAYTAEEQYDLLQELADFIRRNGMYSYNDDDPFKNGIIQLLENDPDAFAVLLQSMLSYYDDRSYYIPAESYDVAMGGGTANYVGVGITMQDTADGVRVSAVDPAGSAAAAGVQPGDIITAVDGVSADKIGFDGMANVIRGEEGTSVTLQVRRGSETLTFDLLRVFIGVQEFESYLLEDGIYYMKLSRFETANAYLLFRDALAELAENQCRVLIFDLRGNHGGLLNVAYSMANLLIPEKDTPFFAVSYRRDEMQYYDPVTSNGSGIDLNKIIFLCDGESASSSEVLMLSLRDTVDAILVGQQTFGKGTGQYEVTLTDGSAVLISGLHLVGIKSGDYDRKGITPDYIVENYTVQNPDAAVQPLKNVPLAVGYCSDDVTALNEALLALGYLNDPSKPYLYDNDTQRALNQLLAARGLAMRQSLDSEAIAAVNAAIAQMEGSTKVYDAQLEKALELAREYVDQPLRYQWINGTWRNLEAK